MNNTNQIQLPYSYCLVSFLKDNWVTFTHTPGDKFLIATFEGKNAAKVWDSMQYDFIDFERQMEENY